MECAGRSTLRAVQPMVAKQANGFACVRESEDGGAKPLLPSSVAESWSEKFSFVFSPDRYVIQKCIFDDKSIKNIQNKRKIFI